MGLIEPSVDGSGFFSCVCACFSLSGLKPSIDDLKTSCCFSWARAESESFTINFRVCYTLIATFIIKYQYLLAHFALPYRILEDVLCHNNHLGYSYFQPESRSNLLIKFHVMCVGVLVPITVSAMVNEKVKGFFSYYLVRNYYMGEILLGS